MPAVNHARGFREPSYQQYLHTANSKNFACAPAFHETNYGSSLRAVYPRHQSRPVSRLESADTALTLRALRMLP